MNNKLKIHLFFGLIAILFLNSLFMSALFAQDKQEIVVTINGISIDDKIAHFNKAEELRNQMKFAEALEEYNYVISPGELSGSAL